MIKSDSDFLKFALNKYDNPHLSSIEEFEADTKRFIYLNNLLNRYRDDPTDLQDRLILNHIVIICNCFSVIGGLEMLRYKISPNNIGILETCLYHLGMINIVITKLDFYLLGILNES